MVLVILVLIALQETTTEERLKVAVVVVEYPRSDDRNGPKYLVASRGCYHWLIETFATRNALKIFQRLVFFFFFFLLLLLNPR